jgi:hypothetical protein
MPVSADIAVKRPVAALTLAALLLAPSAARAEDVAAAEALYREGRALLEKGDLGLACPKLAESQRLDPSSGTALNLALCHLKQGKTATAWAEYLVAARLARQQGKTERVEEAQRRAAELENELSFLTIYVPNLLPGLEVRRDDVLVEAGSFGAKIPVDPGAHKLALAAPGYEPKTLEITIGASRDVQTVTLPALEKSAPAGSTAPPASGPTTPPASGPGALPWAIGGAGLALTGVGAAFGGLALKAYGDAKAACPSRMGCGTAALDLRSTAGVRAKVADVTIPVGLVGVAVSVVLLVKGRARPATAMGPTLDASVGPEGTRAWVTGAF